MIESLISHLVDALELAKSALEKDAEAIGAAQTSEDIDWFKFGQATILKQHIAMPAIESALSEAKCEGITS